MKPMTSLLSAILCTGFLVSTLPNRACADLAEALATPESAFRLDGLTGSKESWNKAKLLHMGMNSAPERLKLIREAQNYVFITVPYWFDDEEGRIFLEAIRKRREEIKAQGSNLDVRVMEDWTSPGSSKDFFGTKMFRKLQVMTGGLALEWNRLWSFRPWSANILKNRIHDKLMVVDGTKLIMGGMNVADDYLQGGLTEGGWHDTDVLFEGPVAQEATRDFLKPFLLQQYLNRPGNPFPSNTSEQIKQLQKLFYGNQGGAVPLEKYTKDATYFPSIPMHYDYTTPVRLIYENPFVDRISGPKNTGAHFSKLLETLEYIVPQAQHSLRLFMPYLSTTTRMNRILINAARRGVKVQIITNSLGADDMGGINYQGTLLNFARLHAAGVEIHEWQGHGDLWALERAHDCKVEGYWPGKTLHTKAVVIDNSVALIGSSNMNFRSERMNSEIMALVRDPAFAHELTEVFEYDLDQNDREPLKCGSESYARPPRTRMVTSEALRSEFHRAGLWLRFLDLFHALM